MVFACRVFVLRVLSLLCAVALVSPAWAAETEFHYQVELNAPSSVESLLEKHLDIYKWQKKNRLTAELMEREINALPLAASDLLATAGYFNAKIDVRYDEAAGKTPTVYIDVDSGPQTMVSNTSVVLQGAVTENTERYDALTARFNRRGDQLENEAFTQSAWDDFKKRNLQTLQSRLYPAATMVSSEATIDPEKHTAQFNQVLDSGPSYVFGDYTINGLTRYPEHIVTDRIQIQPGTPYSRAELLELQTELQDMPQFASALVDVDLSQQAPYIADLRVELQETQLQRWNFGLGYDTNTRFKSEVAYRYLNLFNQGWVFDSRLRIEQLEQAAEVGVTLPKLQSEWEHRVWGSYLHQDLSGVDSQLYKTGASRTKKSGDIERAIDLQYQIEQRQFTDGTEEFPQTLSLNHTWLQRKLDNKRNPRNGYMVQVETGGALKEVLSDATFLRLYGRGAYYLKVGKDDQFIGQMTLGQNFTSEPNKVTSDWLFRTGGSGSVRGYDYQSLGVQSNGSTQGGRVTATVSLEYQIPVIPSWRAAAFVDYGGAGDTWQSMEPVTGVGIGARWNSPVGQIGIDVAYGIDYEQFRLHLAMGLVF